MKGFLSTLIPAFFLTATSFAADVVCSCPDESCSDIRINFVPSSPGVYLTIEYAYGERNTEGFAQVTRAGNKKTVYSLGRFTLVEDDNKYFLPGRDVQCQ